MALEGLVVCRGGGSAGWVEVGIGGWGCGVGGRVCGKRGGGVWVEAEVGVGGRYGLGGWVYQPVLRR